MHLAALTGLATDIAFLQGGASYGRLRTAIINATMRVCGSRFGRGWLRPGGVRFGITEALRQDLLATLAAFAKDMAEVNDLMLGARSVQSRFQGVGVVSRQAALDIGMVGLAARASGVALDARSSLPGRLYTAHPVAVFTEDGGDCWARMKLRMREIDESLRWLRAVLEGPLSAQAGHDGASEPAALTALAPLWHDTLCVSVREGFRGPVVQALETGPDGQLLHYKVQDPSLLELVRAGPGDARQRDLGLPDLQQELRSLVLRQRSLARIGAPLFKIDPSPRLARHAVHPRPASGEPGRLSRPAPHRRARLRGGLHGLRRRVPDAGHHLGRSDR